VYDAEVSIVCPYRHAALKPRHASAELSPVRSYRHVALKLCPGCAALFGRTRQTMGGRRGLLAGVCVCAVLLLAAPRTACGATSCDTPRRWDAAAGLEQAREKFLSCTQARPAHAQQEQWKAPAGQPASRAAPAGVSRIKRPSNVGGIMNRCRTNDAARSTPASSTSASSWSDARRSAGGPEANAMRDAETPARLSVGWSQQQPQSSLLDVDDPMVESPMLLSSTKSDASKHDSLDAHTTPVCTSQMRPSSFGSLGRPDPQSAGADTPHLRASDWAENTPEPVQRRNPLSQKLFAQDEQQAHTELTPVAKLLSSIKAAQEEQFQQLRLQQMSIASDAGGKEYEEEACTLLSNARMELHALNQRWKEAEQGRLQQSRQATALRVELEILREKAEQLEAEKASIFTELRAVEKNNGELQDAIHAVEQQQRKTAQRCSGRPLIFENVLYENMFYMRTHSSIPCTVLALLRCAK